MPDNTAHRALSRELTVIHGAIVDDNTGVDRSVVLIVVSRRPADQPTNTSTARANDLAVCQLAVDQFDPGHRINTSNERADPLCICAVIDLHIVQRQILYDYTGVARQNHRQTKAPSSRKWCGYRPRS